MSGEVALICGGGEGLGRAIALRLAAEGVRVVVLGADERALGLVLGELTCGGGVGRHIAGDLSDVAVMDAAVGKALDHFGRLTFVVAATSDHVAAEYLAHAGRPHLRPHGRMLFAPTSPAEPSSAAATLEAATRPWLAAFSRELPFDGPTCNALSWVASPDSEADRAAEVALFFCSDVADGVNGQLLRVVD